MQIKIRLIIFLLINTISSSWLLCQVNTNIIGELTIKFNNYTEAVPREELFINTDREDFISGEIIRMKLYLIDRKTMKPSDQSKIAYIELLNSESRPVFQSRFALKGGYGNGQIQLPDSLNTGYYLLRAYTSWMKNFLPDNCFVRGIRVFNTTKNNVQIKTFDLTRLTGQDKSPEDVINDSSLIPQLKVIRLENNDLELNITANEEFIRKNGRQLYLLVQTHGNINFTSSPEIKDFNTRIVIPARKLLPGINQINVFDSKGRHLREKYCYNPPSDTDIFDISLIKTLYSTREKVTISISPGRDSGNKSLSASASITVIPSVFNPGLQEIGKYLNGGTEFGLNYSQATGDLIKMVESSDDSLQKNIRSNWIDWDLILSGRLPEITYQKESEEHFLKGRVMYDDRITPLPTETLLLCTPGKEPDFQTTVTDKNGKFKFCLNIDEEKRDLIILPDNVADKKKIILDAGFSDTGLPAWEPYTNTQGPTLPVNEELSINRQIIRIYGIWDSGNNLKPVYSSRRQVRFYGKPDIELILSDYVALPQMEEVFFELLPRVTLRKRENSYEIRIADRINDNRYETTPHLFLDGVKINDASIIARLNPDDVDKIDVIKDNYVVGTYFFPGIINIITKKADFLSIPLPDYMIRFPFRVIEPVLSFIMPEYSTDEQINSTIPDLRNTLYWNPSVIIGKEGSASADFYTSDMPGKYDVIIQGITNDGQIIYKKMSFEVR